MAKKHKDSNFVGNLKETTKAAIIAIVFFLLAILLILASLGNAGMVGSFIYNILNTLLGIGFFLLPLILVLIGIAFIAPVENKLAMPKIIGSIVFFISGIGLVDLISNQGGWIGNIIADPLSALFDFTATLILLMALIIISLLVIFDVALSFGFLKTIWGRLFSKKEKDEKEIEPEIEIPEEDEEEPEEQPKRLFGAKKTIPETDKEEIEVSKSRAWLGKEYVPPPLSLLEGDRGKPGVGDIKANANIIKRTLQNFGISVEIDEVSIGPSVTRYAIKPAEGVKLARIVTLHNDLALALAAHPIRIEAPIPGKSLVGIEVPNQARSTVGLGTLLSGEQFQKDGRPLKFALGKSISGHSHFADLDKMPHLLVAGATGSGKSVSIHAIITSLLYKNSPEHLKFIMVDPKRVELTLYKKIPHLLTPVITDAKKAILALKWAAKEMSRRYDTLEEYSVRDINSYHTNILEPEIEKMQKGKVAREDLPETMPYIVVVIDELADIMSAYPRELESAIVRLAQMSRAVGIHLILSTQRPSVNVITGLIKANVPARIALQTISQVDSRTILDSSGAEKLLGAGDMLFLSAEMSKPIRIQSAFITEQEVKKVVNYLNKQFDGEAPEDIIISGGENGESLFNSIDDEAGDDDDELYDEAKEIVLKAGRASTSYIQRKLRVGYARAARLIDMLEEHCVVGPADGSKPREVLSASDETEIGDNFEMGEIENSEHEHRP